MFGVLHPNTKLRQAERLFENQLSGPESIVNIGGKYSRGPVECTWLIFRLPLWLRVVGSMRVAAVVHSSQTGEGALGLNLTCEHLKGATL